MTVEKLKKVRRGIVYFTLVILVFIGGYYAGNDDRLGLMRQQGLSLSFDQLGDGVTVDRWGGAQQRNVDFNLFWEVWDKLKEQFIDKEKLNESEMVYRAIKGMVSATGDPYTVFLTPDENKRAKDDLNGAFEGVGIQLGFRDYMGTEMLAVISPLEGMPAIKAGVKAGDFILKINDIETTGMTLPEAVELIRGEGGTKVKLVLLSDGDKQSHEIELTREVIKVPSVELDWITEKTVISNQQSVIGNQESEKKNFDNQDGQVGDAVSSSTPTVSISPTPVVEKISLEKHIAHLKVTRFGEQTSKEWNEKVREILSYQKAPVAGIILDLRGNPGGFFQGAVQLGSDLVESGVVVQQEAADGTKEQFRANGSARLVRFPLVIVLNQGSASASEILAGALRELRGAKIVGEESFGKGSVQEAMDLEGDSGLHITTYRWLLPSGASVDENGIEPDKVMADDPKTEEDEQLNMAIGEF